MSSAIDEVCKTRRPPLIIPKLSEVKMCDYQQKEMQVIENKFLKLQELCMRYMYRELLV